MACRDWAGTKAAHRFFSSDRVSEAEILSGQFEATRERFHAAHGTILVLHNTTLPCYHRSSKAVLGVMHRSCVRKSKEGRSRLHTIRGLLLHSSLVLTLTDLPLEIAAVKFWTRKMFKGCNALKRRINPTRVPIEEKESVR